MIKERITKVQSIMKKLGLDLLMIPTNDYHNSEYIPEYFKTRVFLSGFTGSAGTLLISRNSAYLWTDGRYFIQAAKQLEGSGIELMKMGQEGVPTISGFLKKELTKGKTLGLDGKLISIKNAHIYENIAKNNEAKINSDVDFIDEIWSDRPSMPKDKIFMLSEEITGESKESKIEKIRKSMIENGSDYYVNNDLTCICHTLNIRGNDIACVPVVLSYLIISKDEVILFADKNKFDSSIEDVTLRDYKDVYTYFSDIKDKNIQVDFDAMNYTLYNSMSANNIKNIVDPVYLTKAIRNEIQLENIRKAHVSDAIAMINFMYELKTGKLKNIDEVDVDTILTKNRKEQGAFENSFGTIAGYKENAALMHYSAKPDTCKKIENSGMLLIDSGGQYMTGTTDTTRTFILGEITPEERKQYTLVLKSVIALSKQKFLYGCTGLTLDILARQFLWNENVDYQCGTGHGVGHILGVHEGPHGLRWKARPGIIDSATLENGMTVTIEPGIYLFGKFGVRIENELIIREDVKNEYGQFMEFETMTYTPIDLDGIDYSLLTEEEKDWMKSFNKTCYEKTEKSLKPEVRKWLKNYLGL